MNEIKEENEKKDEVIDTVKTEHNSNATKSNKHVLDYYLKLVMIFLVLALVFWIGFERGQENNPNKGQVSLDKSLELKDIKDKSQVDMSLYWEVFDKLKEKYVDAEKLTTEELVYNSIRGMLSATEDPYTVFLDPEENKEFNADIEGTFEGIGAELGIKQGILTVISPLKDSPAERAGLRTGDKILKVNDESTADMSIDVAVSKIRGKDGTEVKLTVYRADGEEKTKDILVKRGVIRVESVTFEMKNNIAYFNVVRFGDDTAIKFGKLISAMPKDAKGVVIDLRNNPGGYLDVAIDMAGFVLPNGKVVVIEEDKEGKKKKFYSRGRGELSGIKTVVLINEGSASASEILAGALKDNRENVTLVGKKSYGKGSVQELLNLKGDSSVKITVARWLTPKEEQINEKGINPDVEIELTEEDYDKNRDPQLDKALELLK
ncbi:MAG TPA: peptidase S41 [Candidatus Moranbacteria bacterium]|nr:MAG: Carboxyl-terminal protease [Candidatus Moranbacteria bacterium GW2011_GWF1_34_10]HBI17256.1 peptidase S41 [Candidatus Moranbacteria bacterium]